MLPPEVYMGGQGALGPEPSGTQEPAPSGTPEGSYSEERVITVTWQAVLLSLVAVMAVAAGYIFGRALSGRAETATPAQLTRSQSDGREEALVLGQADAPVIKLQPARSSSVFPADRVIELPVPSHPLRNAPAPDFTMTLLSTGEEVSLSDYLGQPVLVNFWASWCPPCRFEMPWIQQAYEDNRDAGFVVLAVNAGERVPPSMVETTMKQFVESMGLTFPVLYGDSTFQVQRQWSVLGLPATFFVATDGTVVDMHTGMFPNQVTLEDRVARLLKRTSAGE